MGIYLNPGNEAFTAAVNSELYVDKTELITYTNSRIGKRNTRALSQRLPFIPNITFHPSHKNA